MYDPVLAVAAFHSGSSKRTVVDYVTGDCRLLRVSRCCRAARSNSPSSLGKRSMIVDRKMADGLQFVRQLVTQTDTLARIPRARGAVRPRQFLMERSWGLSHGAEIRYPARYCSARRSPRGLRPSGTLSHMATGHWTRSSTATRGLLATHASTSR